MNIEQWLEQIPKKHARHFYAAYTAALCSPGVGNASFRHGAVLADKKVVVAAGFNSYKTHPNLSEHTDFPHLHAEQSAMFRRGLENCTGLDLYVIRVRRDGSIGYSKPCDVCCHFINEAGISNVYYSAENHMVKGRN